MGELEVAYQFAPPYEPRLLTWQGWERTGMSRAELRRAAAAALYQRLDQVAIHGQPPALMLSFDGLESSVLLAHPFWDDLAASIPGDVVVGVPARDVVIFTGTESPRVSRRCAARSIGCSSPAGAAAQPGAVGAAAALLGSV